MVHLATEDYPKLKPSDIKIIATKLYGTLVHLEEKYPDRIFHDYGRRQSEVFTQMENFEVLYKIMKSMFTLESRMGKSIQI
jgi:nicotinate-nucleotide adenylyltransferase